MTIPDTVVPYQVAIKNAVPLNVATLTNRILLQTYAPPSVTTDIEGHILYVHGDTSLFLHQPAGEITTNLIDMARVGLQLELRTALQAATMGKSTLNREVSLKKECGTFTASFSMRLFPFAHPEDKAESRLLLVSFQEVFVATKPAKHQSNQRMLATETAARTEQLECELIYTRENLQATIEEQQATNEELKSTNEELQSANEELQSANEELETSREELQSMNEEMLTMNSELNNKIEQLSSSQNDFKNLMDNVNAGVVFLDYHLNIRSYTRDAVKAYRLIATDVGRPLSDITSNLQGDDFTFELHTVLETLIPHEREVQARDGAWYLARMQPYRTLDNVIDGVVLSFTDITLNRETAKTKFSTMQLACELAEGIVNTVSEPLIVIGADLQVISASQAFYQKFQVVPAETVGRKIYDLGNGQWNIPLLCQLLEGILPKQQVIEGFVVEHNFPELGTMRMVLNARRIKTIVGDTELILLAIPTIEKKELP